MRQMIVDALLTFVWFTTLSTPYMIWIVGLTQEQYIEWVAMKAFVVPPMGIGFLWISRKLHVRMNRPNE